MAPSMNEKYGSSGVEPELPYWLFQKLEAWIFPEPAPGGIPFCAVDSHVCQVIEDGPYGVFSCFSVILAQEAVFAR